MVLQACARVLPVAEKAEVIWLLPLADEGQQCTSSQYRSSQKSMLGGHRDGGLLGGTGGQKEVNDLEKPSKTKSGKTLGIADKDLGLDLQLWDEGLSTVVGYLCWSRLLLSR